MKALEEYLKNHITKYSKLEYITFRFQCDNAQVGDTIDPSQMYLKVVDPDTTEPSNVNPKPKPYKSALKPQSGKVLS